MSHDSRTVLVPVNPAVKLTAYASGNCVGGIQTLTNAMLSGKPGGLLESVVVTDRDNQKAALTLLLFDAQPAGGTYTDGAGLVLSTADLAALVAVVSIAAANYTSVGSQAVGEVAGINAAIDGPAGTGANPAQSTGLWALLMTTGTPTYTNAASLNLRLGIKQD